MQCANCRLFYWAYSTK